MKITILNGNADSQNKDFDLYLAQLAQILEADQHQVTALTLREMNLRYCVGCFGCWVKTPGECTTPDDSSLVCQVVINADFMLWASPMKMGFPSAVLKKMMDKSIPLIHPYFTVEQGEAHHRPRYDHYPKLGLLLERENDTDAEDIRIVTDIFSRTALNMKSRLILSTSTDQPVEQTAQAITSERTSGELFDTHPQPTAGVRISPPQLLTVFNGSPRGAKGNTPLLLEQFLKGFSSNPGHRFEVFHLNHIRDAENFCRAFRDAECTLVGFPLYTDAMPGIVKAFIETLEPCKGRSGNPPVGFIVQSGFPESLHSRNVEQYLKKLASRLGSPYLGTIVKGGCEGIQSMPKNMTQKLFNTFYQIGKNFGKTGQLDPELLRGLAKPEKYPAILAPFFKMFVRLPIASFYWDRQLRQNGAYERRFAMPYMSDISEGKR
jgi:multimeric flavodoxin WrbA